MKVIGFIVTIAPILIILTLLCGGYMMIRNEWVYSQRTNWQKNFEYYYSCMKADDKETYDAICFNKYLYNMKPYQVMFHKFWVWDVKEFVRNKEIYDLVNNYAIGDLK